MPIFPLRPSTHRGHFFSAILGVIAAILAMVVALLLAGAAALFSLLPSGLSASLAMTVCAAYALLAAWHFLRTGRAVYHALRATYLQALGKTWKELTSGERGSMRRRAWLEPIAWSGGLLLQETAFRMLQQVAPQEAERLRYHEQFQHEFSGLLALLPGVKTVLENYMVRKFLNHPQPIRLTPQIQPYVWGQSSDQSYILKLLQQPMDAKLSIKIAEMWLGAHSKNPAVVHLGGLPMALDQFAARIGAPLLGKNRPAMGQLFKVLDAAEPLSLQIHEQAPPHGKNETWMIRVDRESLHNTPDHSIAELYLGFRTLEEQESQDLPTFKTEYLAQVGAENQKRYFQQRYARALEKGKTDPEGREIKAFHNKIEVRWEQGQVALYINDQKQPPAIQQAFGLDQGTLVVNIPGGTPHALQKGTVFELQQMADKTLRLYDQGRDEKNRPLHIQEAMEKIDFKLVSAQDYLMKPQKTDENRINLIRSEYYGLDRIDIIEKRDYLVSLNGDYHIIIVIEGNGWLCCAGQTLPLKQGTIIMIPAALSSYQLKTDLKLSVFEIFEAFYL